MINILIAYDKMDIGGSTTSLLGLLNSIDYTKYNVDLQLYEYGGVYDDLIPKEVTLLPEATRFKYKISSFKGLLERIIHLSYLYYGIWSWILKKKYPSTKACTQIQAYARAITSKRSNKKYDVAIGFMEFWSDVYVIKRIKANKKIGWIHVDYKNSGLVPEIDRKLYSRFDRIILVSENCLNSFNEIFPQYSTKAYFLENIISRKIILERSNMEYKNIKVDGVINFGTVCRIEFHHKGLDRALLVLKKIKDEGYNFVWHIIGDGTDFTKLLSLIKEYKLEKEVILYGSKFNPLPYIKQFDIFLLPSLYEGKPMVVTEVQMLGIPVMVTNYLSSKEQVNNGVDGLIMENSEEGILKGITNVLQEPFQLKIWSKNLKKKNWNYLEIINKFEKIIEEL